MSSFLSSHQNERYTGSGSCVQCCKDKTRSQVEKGYYTERYKEKNSEIRKWHKEYHQKNKEKIIYNSIEYHKKNREQRRETVRRYKQKKRLESPAYVIATRIGAGVRIALNKLKCPKKSKTVEILGCSFEEFRSHIERQFVNGMCWERISEIHIEHIVPISSAKTEEDVSLGYFTSPIFARCGRKTT